MGVSAGGLNREATVDGQSTRWRGARLERHIQEIQDGETAGNGQTGELAKVRARMRIRLAVLNTWNGKLCVRGGGGQGGASHDVTGECRSRVYSRRRS